MRRIGCLKDKILETDNLALAAHKAFRRKRTCNDVKEFSSSFVENIVKLRNDIITGNVIIGDYKYFKIYDPKERLICAASLKERILHHSIMNVCQERFEKTLIYDTYATRPGKGLYAALDRAKLAMIKYQYYAKLDVKKYFDSIEHTVLKKQLRRLFKDVWLLDIFDRIIDSYSVKEGRGLPIGNLTSQYFANYYLSELDHYMKEKLSVSLYIRYMDDVLICCNDKGLLKNWIVAFEDFAYDRLGLTIKKSEFGKCNAGVSFLGYRVMPGYLLLNGRSKRRFVKKMILYKNKNNANEMNDDEYVAKLLPLLAFVRHAKTRRFRKKVIEKLEM